MLFLGRDLLAVSFDEASLLSGGGGRPETSFGHTRSRVLNPGGGCRALGALPMEVPWIWRNELRE